MPDTRSEKTLMALLALKPADLAAEVGAAVPGLGRRTSSLPSLDERIEMFARMICGPDVAITPEIRALARDQILDAMAGDLIEETTDFAPEPQNLIAAAAPLQTAQRRTPTAAAPSPISTGFISDLRRLLTSTASSFSVLRLGMAAVPLVALLIAGSVLTHDWLSGGVSDQGPTATEPKTRSFEQGTADTAAEQNLQRAIAAEEAAHGRSSPAVARKLVDLAVLLRADRRYAEAQALCERALIIQDRALGSNNPETLRTIKELATVYRAEGRIKDADEILTRANQP